MVFGLGLLQIVLGLRLTAIRNEPKQTYLLAVGWA